MKTTNTLEGNPLRKGEHRVDLYYVKTVNGWVAGHPRYIGHPKQATRGPREVTGPHCIAIRASYDQLKWAEQAAAMFPGSEIEHYITRGFYL